MSGTIREERRPDGVAVLWLANPAMRNAVSDAMIDAMIERFGTLGQDAACRAVVLRGEGGLFCAGRELNNLRALGEASPDAVAAIYRTLRRLNEAVYYCPKPTVAVLERFALGLGAALSSWADIAIAEPDVQIGYPEVLVGLPPSQTTVNLIRSVPRKLAMDLLLTARTITGEEALAMGLVSRTVAKGEIEAGLETVLAQLVRASPDAIRRTKRTVWKVEDADYAAACDVAVESICDAIGTSDAREGIAAFLEKRRPRWQV